ncbi:MAG: nuclear transport factor 2 family protein [Flavobacteriales bacterium]|nr:nuclear transport factor 2 family protein [Flavobacteriales bacterium]MCB9168570.1 nuclear transport factor 2 family protein [Flavobacteriales bacterium]
MSTITRFYDAFARHDWATMGACYHADGHFSDPVFGELTAEQVKAMWRMLLTSGTDLRVTYRVVQEDGDGGTAIWDAYYTFSRTGRRVHNHITAEMRFKDGLIIEHNDTFSFWRWSRQALGSPGLLLGWSPILRNKLRGSALAGLRKAMARS